MRATFASAELADDREASRAYSFVLTYVVYVCCWLALGLGLLAPWLLRLITTEAAVSPLPITHTLWASCFLKDRSCSQ